MLCFAYYMYSYLCTIELNVIYSSCRARSFRHTITTTPLYTAQPCVIDAPREDRSVVEGERVPR